jgi:hypothetical protein
VSHHVMEMIHDVIEWVALGIELLAVAVIVGAVIILAIRRGTVRRRTQLCQVRQMDPDASRYWTLRIRQRAGAACCPSSATGTFPFQNVLPSCGRGAIEATGAQGPNF